MTFELYIESISGLIESKTAEMLRYLDEVTEGIYDALAKKLSPKIVDPGTMRTALTQLIEKAGKKGYHSVTNVISHIFELDTDAYLNKASGILHILIHIPLYHAESEHELWKRAEIPSILPLNETGSEALDNHHTVYDIERTGEYVATNGEATFPVKQSALDECKRMGSNYYCLYLLRRRYSIRDSCEVALFMNELESVGKLCKITVRTIPETAVAISNRDTYIYSDAQTIQVECTDLDGVEYKRQPDISGLVKLTLPPLMDCTVITRSHIWRDVYLTEEFEMRSKPVRFGIKKLMGITYEELSDHAKERGLKPFEGVTVSEIVNQLEQVKYRKKTQWIAISIGIVILLIMLAVCGILFYLYSKKKGWSFLQELRGFWQQFAPKLSYWQQSCAVFSDIILADNDQDPLEDEDRFEEYYFEEDFEDFVQDIRHLFLDHREIQVVANRAAEEHVFYDWDFNRVIPDEFLDFNFVRNARADQEVQQQLGNLDLAAPEVQIPVPQYLPHGVTLDDYQSGNYQEYRRGFIFQGIYQFYPNNWYNNPARSSNANSETSQVRGRRAGTHNKLNRLLRLVGDL